MEANRIVDILENGSTVLLQRGGAEFTVDTALSCLVQVIVDPYYRTLHGFCVLIEKEWIRFGYVYWFFFVCV